MAMTRTRDEEDHAYDPNEEPREERPYYDTPAEKEEIGKVPVEYLAYLQRRRESRREQVFFWLVVLIVVIGLAPGTRGKDYSARTGEWRDHLTFAWGRLEYADIPRPTEFTEWYMSKNPQPHTLRWVPYEKTYPAIFGYLAIPVRVTDLGWEMPENLTERMTELDGLFRPGYVLEIPRVLYAVKNAEEWNAIIVPLMLGTPAQAFDWWSHHSAALTRWSQQEYGTPLPQEYIDEAAAYVEEIKKPNGNHIPLMPH